MQGKRVIAEEGEFSERFRQTETARAIKSILKANSFIVLTRTDRNNQGVSCVDGKDIPFMAHSCKKMETELIETAIELMKKGMKYDNEEKGN
jgi:hypothetical protein